MEFIYEVTEDMPFDIRYPKGYEEWIRKTLPACIFYDRFKKVMHCTRCGYTGEYDYKIRKGDRVICPECGEELTAFSHTTPQLGCDATFLHFWKTKSAIYYAEVWAAWNYNYAKANDELLKACVKNYSPTREMDETTRIVPLSIGKITRKEQRAWQRWWSYRHGRSCAVMDELKEVRLIDYQAGWWKLHPNTAKLLSKTFIGVSEYQNIRDPKLLVKEIALHAKHPGAEYVAKAGLGEYIQETIDPYGRTYIRPNWKAKTLPGFLRLSAQDIDKLRKWDMLNVENIAYYKKLAKYRKKPQLEDLQLMKKWLELGALYSGRIKGDPVKLARYFEKQFRKRRFKYRPGMISQYMDYEHMLDILGYPEDDYYKYPKDLKEAHDRLTAEYNAHVEAERQRQKAEERKQMLEAERYFIEEILPKLQLYNMQDEKYLIRALESVEDFKKEGRQNHNCVGTYADRAIRGKVKIFVLRKADTPNESFVTIELAPDEKSIKQCYGRGNSLPDEEVKAWVDNWLKTVVKKKGRKKAA
ncbi:MAG: PcfJ domain-containing protein [Mogibacterium sp.]|nr:PcfJ domain-containing protein [Mogibacterium sp.]